MFPLCCSCCEHTCVFGYILQQQRVFGQPLHLDGNDVFELQPAALWLALRLLHQHTATVGEPSPPCSLHSLESAGRYGTSMKELKRGSFFCLFLIWSKAHDWWLQNLAVSFWNHSPSVPSNLNTHPQFSFQQDVCGMTDLLLPSFNAVREAVRTTFRRLTLLSSVVLMDLTMKLSSKRNFFRFS